MKRMLDLCSGLEGASAAMKDHGWQVITVDNNPAFKPTIVADIRKLTTHELLDIYAIQTGEIGSFDFIWASPPCVEFAREFMPWSKTGNDPDMSILLACKRIIDEWKPRYWVIENVKGAMKWFYPYLGRPSLVINPYYFWGTFPPISKPRLNRRNKESMSSSWDAERAKIPYGISQAFYNAISKQPQLFDAFPKSG